MVGFGRKPIVPSRPAFSVPTWLRSDECYGAWRRFNQPVSIAQQKSLAGQVLLGQGRLQALTEG